MYQSFGAGLRRIAALTWVATAFTTLAIALGRCLRLWFWDFDTDPELPVIQPVPKDDDEAEPKAVVLSLLIEGSGTSPRKIKVLNRTKISHIMKTITFLFPDPANGYNMRDFEVCLMRPDGEVVLDYSHILADYGIKSEDQILLRRKNIPFDITVKLWDGKTVNIQINAASLPPEAVRSICQQLEIKHYEEMSLASRAKEELPGTEETAYGAIAWLHSSKSLQEQGIQDKDTLFLKKKFFIVNKDVEEAVEKKNVLLDLQYHQLKEYFLHRHGLSSSVQLPTVSAFLHHVEQEHADITDEEATKNVLPKGLRDDAHFFQEVIEAYGKENIKALTGVAAKCKVVSLLSKHCVTTGYFPVKLTHDGNDHILVIMPQTVTVCAWSGGQLHVVQEWSVEQLRKFEGSEESFTFMILGERQTVFTPQAALIANYLQDMLQLIKNADQVLSYNERQPGSEYPIDIRPFIPGSDNSDTELDDSSSDEDHTPAKKQPFLPHHIPKVTPSPSIPEATQKRSRFRREDSYQQAIQHGLSASERLGPSKAAQKGSVRFENIPESPSSPAGKKKFLPRQPSYFELEYQQLLQDYRLFHFIILNQDVRELLVNIHQPTAKIIKNLCSTFGIENPEDYCLWIPRGVHVIIEQYGGKPKYRLGKFFKGSVAGAYNPKLIKTKSIQEQYNFDIKPFILHLRRKLDDENGADDGSEASEEAGQEWPEFEIPGVARQRKFHQCWCGIVQGDYPVEHITAVEVAGLLTQVYFGDRSAVTSWPPENYDARMFLPPIHRRAHGIEDEVEEAHKKYEGTDKTEAIEKVIELCMSTLTYEGIFFEVKVPVETGSLFSWKKLTRRLFGINNQGVFNIDRKTGEILFIHRFSDVHNWSSSNTTVHVNFQHWDVDYYAYTYQAKEIDELLQLFISTARRDQNWLRPIE